MPPKNFTGASRNPHCLMWWLRFSTANWKTDYGGFTSITTLQFNEPCRGLSGWGRITFDPDFLAFPFFFWCPCRMNLFCSTLFKKKFTHIQIAVYAIQVLYMQKQSQTGTLYFFSFFPPSLAKQSPMTPLKEIKGKNKPRRMLEIITGAFISENKIARDDRSLWSSAWKKPSLQRCVVFFSFLPFFFQSVNCLKTQTIAFKTLDFSSSPGIKRVAVGFYCCGYSFSEMSCWPIGMTRLLETTDSPKITRCHNLGPKFRSRRLFLLHSDVEASYCLLASPAKNKSWPGIILPSQQTHSTSVSPRRFFLF